LAGYLDSVSVLEAEYPGVTFVYMTGHLEGTGVDGNLNVRNDQIRSHCRANNKVLFDFADIESYNPDGVEFMSRLARDTCYYDGNGDGSVDSANWAQEWCASHAGDPLCATCSCAHSEPLNCNLKGRAFWWMLARIAGWPGPLGLEEPSKSASDHVVEKGDTVTYTIQVANATPFSQTVGYVTDTLPLGLAYVPDSLAASAGTVTETEAPTLYWSGILSPMTVVSITYATLVTTPDAHRLVNQARFRSAALTDSGQQVSPTLCELEAAVMVNPIRFHLPVILKAGD
jgi:uncharacterized repeat protein (TIGR01451 family)